MELVPQAADVGDVPRPRDRHPLAGAAKVRRDLLYPLEGSIERPRPRHGHVRVCLVGAPGLIETEILKLWQLEYAVGGGQPVRRAHQRAFRTRAVVAVN